LRDGGLCQSPVSPPVCLGKLEAMDLLRCHVDHIIPLSRGGSNHVNNLRLLCPVCHALREDVAHNTLRSDAIAKGLLPLNWRELTWA
jgi:5-methylcytosine-specific restriction endonuclease McrA